MAHPIQRPRRRSADELPPPHEHLPRERTLLSMPVKHERACYAIGRHFSFRFHSYPSVGRVAHSITSSARARSVGGIVMPRAVAVLKLMISSNFVGCSTGKSAGFSPLR